MIPLVMVLLVGCIHALDKGPVVGLPIEVKVGIIEDSEEVKIRGDKDLVIDCGDKKIQGKGVYRFSAAESKEAGVVYIQLLRRSRSLVRMHSIIPLRPGEQKVIPLF